MGKWFGKSKAFGVSKLDLEIMSHRGKHGPLLDPEVLAHCPICNAEHKVLHFMCSCGDPFFCHLNNMENQFQIGKQPNMLNSPLFH